MPSERHLQCLWYNDVLRPRLVAADGTPIIVESCGRWNLEAGPDFLDASLLVGESRRRIRGDVELHLRPSGWTNHGHATDPRYANVILHVTYLPGPRPVDLPVGVLSVSLRDALRAFPNFSFDEIDVTAYPHAVIPDTPRPCRAIFNSSPDRALALLRKAGLHRAAQKRHRMRTAIRFSGDPAQVLYEGVLVALGYKRNAASFRLLARALPLSQLTTDRLTNFARLLGVAGLLPEFPVETDPRATLVQQLWDRWWRNAIELPATPISWVFDAVRPQNNPVRRIAAAAALFSQTTPLAEWLEQIDFSQAKFPAKIRDRLIEQCSFPEMEPFYDFLGNPPQKSAALIGPDRAAAIVTNAILPWLAARHPHKVKLITEKLPTETTSAPMRATACHLFGPDHNPRVLYEGNGILQQGLLQIYNDYCLNGCHSCRLAAKYALPSESR